MSEPNVFDFLDQIRARPTMFVGEDDKNLSGLRVVETLMEGYYTGLGVHGVGETVPRVTFDHFSHWLRLRGYAEFSLGWAWVLHEAHGDAAFDKFFDLLDDYRKVSPTVVATVALTECHRPRKQRSVWGSADPMEKPDRVELVRYVPDPIHIVRYHYGSRFEEHVVYLDPLAKGTTLEDAYTWAAQELRIERSEWSTV